VHVEPRHEHVVVLVQILAFSNHCHCKLANQNVRPNLLLVRWLVKNLEVFLFRWQAASFKDCLILVAEQATVTILRKSQLVNDSVEQVSLFLRGKSYEILGVVFKAGHGTARAVSHPCV